MEGIFETLDSIPSWGRVTLSILATLAIAVWTGLDIKKRRQWQETRSERMQRLKQEAIAKLREDNKKP